MVEWYVTRLRNETPASECLSQIRDCNKVHKGFNDPIMGVLCVIYGFVDTINVVVDLLYFTSWNTDSAVTGKAMYLIWKYSVKRMQLPFLTAISSSANKQLFLSCWGTALKQTEI